MSDKVTTRSLKQWKKEGRKITAITAYDTPMARLADAAMLDVILVGDSVGNVVLGYPNTLPVTVEDMLHHLKAVRQGVQRALLVLDMPFLSYGVDEEDAVYNAGRFLQAGAEAVKVEGASEGVLESIEAMIAVGIPVMGHLGMTPQSVHQFGGYRVQGRSEEAAMHLIAAAQKLEAAGVFSIVLELIPADLARQITETVQVPTIGIGAGPHCDGQIQVMHDLLGLTPEIYKHAKLYADVGTQIRTALEQYATEVREGKFPTEEYSF